MSACERHVHHAARSLHSYTHPPQPPVSHQPTAEGDVPGEVSHACEQCEDGVKNGHTRTYFSERLVFLNEIPPRIDFLEICLPEVGEFIFGGNLARCGARAARLLTAWTRPRWCAT